MLFDLVGALFSLLSTYYFIRLNTNAWIISIAATGVNGWLYWQKGIYADMVLEVLYFLTVCYGWYQWQQLSERKTQTTVHTFNILSKKQWYLFIFILGIVFLLINFILQTMTHSTVAFLDAATTSLSLAAQWLMCHKIIATWILWFITDALYALLYFGKNLPYHSLLMLVYTGMAVTGYWVWAKHHTRPKLSVN